MDNQQTDMRSAFLKAAEIKDIPLLPRLMRSLARQAPLRTAARIKLPDESLDPYTFVATEEGSGAFGRWDIDAELMPVYRYDMNQRRDVRAYYVNSVGLDRRDHWHQIGNKRITGLASNDGVVQLYIADRGGVFANRFEAYDIAPPTTLVGYFDAFLRWVVRLYGRISAWWYKLRSRDQLAPRGLSTEKATPPPKNRAQEVPESAYAGGFGYLDDGEEVWATAFRYSPETAKTTRTMGIGYFESETTYRDIRQTHRVYAPNGEVDRDGASPSPNANLPVEPNTEARADMSNSQKHDCANDPLILIDVEIENQRQTAVDLRYYEYWDVNVYQLQVEWFRTGLFAWSGDLSRAAINRRFEPHIAWDSEHSILRFHQQRKDLPLEPDELNGKSDPKPGAIFLAALGTPPAGWYADKGHFFGAGSVYKPEAVKQRDPGETEPPTAHGLPMPFCMVLRYDLHLEPGAKVQLHFGYGIADQNDNLDYLSLYRQPDWWRKSLEAWGNQVSYFATPNNPILQRETSWHAYKLFSATVYSEFYNAHYIPQGSAYLYLHGADGAPRDQALFVLPMVYARPGLARDILRLLMQMQHADTLALPYSFSGNGHHDNALGLHALPSDLDLFFLLAMAEYLAATGDYGFLHEFLTFYPPGTHPAEVPGITVLNHIQAAFKHLMQRVGFGSSGLLKLGDGDWDDGIVIQTALAKLLEVDRVNTIQNGESVPNSQMALYVLPLVANLLKAYDPVLAAEMLAVAELLRKAVKKQWGGQWFYRAVLRGHANEPYIVSQNHVNLQAQPWALISGLAAEMGIEDQLIQSVTAVLDDPSPTGAMLDVGGAVWPAVSQLLTWGYMRRRPDLAWRSLNRHTYAAHATAFPNVWFNIWSGPDGTNSKDGPNPGGTWSSPVTPMTDFPVMNANQDAMALLGLLRTCGIEPALDGLKIVPKAPLDRYILDTELLYLDVAPGRVTGEYRAVADGHCVLHLGILHGAKDVKVTLDSRPITTINAQSNADEISLPLIFQAGQMLRFEVSWT